MERAWIIVSTVCVVAAAFCLWRSQGSEAYGRAAFVAATLGVVAWFLRLRTQLRKTIPPAPDETAAEAAEEYEDEDEN